MTEHLPKIGPAFAADTSGHQLTILLDQGPHKNLRAHGVDPETGRPLHLYRVDLITWPSGAAISGDMDGFTFAADLTTLRAATQNGIRWSYLAGKVDAGAQNVRGYSEDVFREYIRDQVARDIRDRTAPRGIGRAVRDQVFDAWEYNLNHEADARHALKHFTHAGYRFDDVEHEDFDDYTTDFERAALGAALVIRLYDRHLSSLTARTADATLLSREVYDRQRLVDEYRGDWAIDPVTVTEIPRNRCPVCGTPAAEPEAWSSHMADHRGEGLSWLARYYDTRPVNAA